MMMVDTNALLTAALALISEFHGAIKVPQPQFLQSPSAIRRAVVGSPSSPIDVFLEDKHGTSYSISGGAVYRYETANSFSALQDPASLPHFVGSPTLSSNDVLSVAAGVVSRLVKNGLPRTNGPPRLTPAGSLKGAVIPFYGVSWPSTNSVFGYAALVEVDARSGEITYLNLTDPCFRDHTLAIHISNRVCHVDSGTGPTPPTARSRPAPPRTAAVECIVNCSEVCRKLGMRSDSGIDLEGIDWDRSCVYSNKSLSPVEPVYQIDFKNGAKLQSLGSAIISFSMKDKYYTVEHLKKRAGNMDQFSGTVRKRWQDLASDFESNLKTRFGFGAQDLLPFQPGPSVGDYEAVVGSRTITRVVVVWRQWPSRSPPSDGGSFLPVSEAKVGFAVEFDTGTGDTKGFAFYDPTLIAIFARQQTRRE